MNNKQVKTALITGANRGLGYAIARAASDFSQLLEPLQTSYQE